MAWRNLNAREREREVKSFFFLSKQMEEKLKSVEEKLNVLPLYLLLPSNNERECENAIWSHLPHTLLTRDEGEKV